MLSWLLSFLSSTTLGKLLDYFGKRSDDSAQIAITQIQAEIQTRQIQQQVIAVEEGWWATAWIRPSIVYPFSLHLGAVTFDSIFHFGWKIAALPAPIDSLEQAVVLSFFITRPFEKVSRNILDYIRNK